jgi:predicted DNA-binding protein (MmcQ/YjbR family)
MISEARILKQLRTICAALPNTTETTSFGQHATFKAKKRTFAVYENQPAVHGTRIISVKTTRDKQAKLAAREGFSLCKFGARHGWIYIHVDGEIDWTEVRALVADSHALVTS